MNALSDELEVLLDKLTKEVYVGRTHLWIWRHLNNALVAKPDVSLAAHVFFSLTLQAHCDEAFLYLARLFDKRRDAVKLRMLEECVVKNAGRFQKLPSDRVRSELLPEIHKQLGPLEENIQPVLNRRHHILAHFDSRGLTNFETLANESELTIGQMEDLYKKSGDILNEVWGPYNGSMNMMELAGWDDFERVLELMERGRNAELDDLAKGFGI